MLLTDYLLKFMTTGQEVQGIYPFEQRSIDTMLSELHPHLCKIIDTFRNAEHSGALHRFWIEAQEIDVDLNSKEEKSTHTRIRVNDVRMVVKKHRMERDIDGNLKDVGNEDEGWPIYALSEYQMDALQNGFWTIPGHAMIFVKGTKNVLYWEHNQVIKTHPAKMIEENWGRLFQQPKNTEGLVTQDTNNAWLCVYLTRELARQSGMAHRYTPELIFAHDFTEHYDEFAQVLPEFGRLKELSRISTMVRMMDGIRRSNKESLDAMNALINNEETPAQTESYCHYASVLEQKLQHAEKVFGPLRKSVFEANWLNHLLPIKSKINAMEGQQKLNAKDSLIDQYRSQLGYGPEVRDWINWFLSGISNNLVICLAFEERKRALESLAKQFKPNYLDNSGNSMDFYRATQDDSEFVRKAVRERFFADLEPHRRTKANLQKHFENLDFAIEEPRPEEKNEEDRQCYWVPTSIRHEVQSSSSGSSRYSFFVYGGVNLQSKINVNQRNNVTLNGQKTSSASFNRKEITKGFQDHHIVSNKNQATKTHELFALSGINPNSRVNKIYLPVKAENHPTRSIHLGRHNNALEVVWKVKYVINQGINFNEDKAFVR